jgi:hypothetical protein
MSVLQELIISTYQKMAFFIATAVNTSNLTQLATIGWAL